jgi:multidrug efflux pump subunit AcrA (membrane-fusion protein)
VGDSKGGKADVYVIKDGKAKKVPIEVGADDGIRVEVRSGLDPKDEVIKDPSSVTEGIPVKAVRQVTAGREPLRS